MASPAFVLVHGACNTAKTYDYLREGLAKQGLESVAVQLPTVGAVPSLYDMTEDVAAVREANIKLVDEGKDVIVVGHSYGGVPAADAVQGLSKAERTSKGLLGGVTRLVMIMTFLFPAGATPGGERGDKTMIGSLFSTDDERQTFSITRENAMKLFFNDLSEAEAEKWADQVTFHSIGIFWSKINYGGWQYIPTTFVVCTNDLVVPINVEEGVIALANNIKPGSVDRIEKIHTGHFPMLSRPELIVDILKKSID